mgnify:CR=1 FL=1
MYILMACMLMLSRHSVILFGGIGVTTLTVGDGTMVGDGIVLTMAGDITRVHGAAGMVATGVASMAAVAIGDIITTGVVVLAGAGAVEAAAIGLATHIQIVVLMLLTDQSLPLVVQIITVHRLVEQQV